MDPDVKPLPFYHSYRALGTLCVPAFAIMLLAILWIDYHRSKVDGLGAFAFAINGLVIALGFFRLRTILAKITEEQIDRKTLGEIWACVTMMACLAFVACIAAVGLVNHTG